MRRGSHFDPLPRCPSAGSERTGLSAQEGNPNASLTLMSMIVKDIASGRTRHNFRQSKLTHLLQPALTGQCRMGLVFTLNPCTARGATSTVRFAQSMMNMPDAKLVRNPVKMTEAQVCAAPPRAQTGAHGWKFIGRRAGEGTAEEGGGNEHERSRLGSEPPMLCLAPLRFLSGCLEWFEEL